MSIGIVDTSIFLEILRVPGKSQQPDEVLSQMQVHIRKGVKLLLPMATVLETGNHIAQNGNGDQRRITATRFVREVQRAIIDEVPWTISRPLFNPDDLNRYLAQFPDYAANKTGLGDLSIIKEFEYLCKMNPRRHIFIWSLDSHLRAYDRHGS